MANRIASPFIEILGKKYFVDSYTNVTPRILDNATRRLYDTKFHPLNLVSERIRHFFKHKSPENIGYKYDEFKFDSPVVTTEDNFDSLLVPKDHVSRRIKDTYYVNSQNLFRSHTSAHQAHCIELGSRAFMIIADCYRRDEIDSSHFPTFHQCEVFKLFNYKEVIGLKASIDDLYDPNINETELKQGIYSQEASSFVIRKLKECIESFVRDFFDNSDLETRWVSAYFPFTHPSYELEIFWKGQWMEVLGCGVVRDEILKNTQTADHIGFAAGFGLERFAMLKYAIPDIRLFWSNDTGITHQFEGKSPFDRFVYKPISSCPQCINDLSFWLPDGADSQSQPYDTNDFYDLCRSVSSDLIEQVKLVDEFTHPKTKKTSHCYRIVYRALDRVLTKDEVNLIHGKIADACRREFKVELR